MPPKRPRRQKGFKAFDPFCRDKLRVALYKRPNGPHQGKLILGKTYLSGLDGKCFSRTGRIKKGYRNVPVDLEREFEIEKKQIQKIDNMLHGSTESMKKQRAESKKQRKHKLKGQQIAAQQLEQRENQKEEQAKKAEIEQQKAVKREERLKEKLSKKYPKYEKWKRFKNITDSPRDLTSKKKSSNREKMQSINRKLKELEEKEEEMNANKPLQPMDALCRFPHESFREFLGRVKRTANYHLHAERQNENRETLKEKESALQKKLRKQQEEIEQKRMLKMERVQRMKEDQEFEEEMKGRKEEIAFGETNNAPPVDLHKLGQELFGKRVNNNSVRNENLLNVSGLSFAKTIENRAHQMTKNEVLGNYAKMKQRELLKRKRNAIKQRNAKRKVWRTK